MKRWLQRILEVARNHAVALKYKGQEELISLRVLFFFCFVVVLSEELKDVLFQSIEATLKKISKSKEIVSSTSTQRPNAR
jgi:hypothetical protein